MHPTGLEPVHGAVPIGGRVQLSVVVPTYNERERIAELVHAILAACRQAGIHAEVVIVDDNSPDGTGEVAAHLATQDDAVRVIRRPGKLGLGSAVMDGFRAAHGAALGVMDADFSHPPALVPELYRTLMSGEADFVVASRYVRGGSTPGWPMSRRLMSRLACLLARPFTAVKDGTSGFFLFRREAIAGIVVFTSGFKIALELLVRSGARRVVEVPYAFVDRTTGRSKMTLREGLGYLAQLGTLGVDHFRKGTRR